MDIATTLTGFYITFSGVSAIALGGTFLEKRRAQRGDMVGAESAKTTTTILLATIAFGALFYFIAIDFPLINWMR